MTEETHHHPRYFWVCGWLALLTLVEVYIPEMALGTQANFWSLTIIAIVKAALVALFFMHLLFEKARLVLFILTPVIGTLLLLLVLLVDAWGIGVPV